MTPALWVIMSCKVGCRRAGSVPPAAVATFMFLSCGRTLLMGSFSSRSVRSTSISVPAAVMTFVSDASGKIAFFGIGVPAALSRKPNDS